jgi:hypothetical protein
MTFMNLRLLPARAGAMTAGPIGKWRRVNSRGEGGDPQASKHNFQETHNLISAGHLLLSVQLCWEVPMNDEEIRFKDIEVQPTENVSE